jgi:hypothetical protein
MIGVSGQYLFIFNLGDKKDFIEEADLIGFKCFEEAGNILPTFQLEFRTSDSEIPRYLNEGNELKVSVGKSLQDVETYKLLIQHTESGRQGQNKISCVVTGILSALKYHKNNILITPKQDGITTIQQITSKNFIFDSNVISTGTDTMNWIQHGISDKKFINSVWMHTYIPDSFLAVGISMDNHFIIRDIKKKFQSGIFDWRLSSRVDTDKDISYDGDYTIQSKAGFINAWMGHKRIKPIYDLDSGEFSSVSQEIKPLIAITNKLMRRAEIESKNAEIGVTSSNVHSNYWKAYLANLSSLAIFSTVKISVSFQNQFKNVRVLDSVMFREVDTQNSQVSMEYSSGLYIVSKVGRILSNRQFLTVLELCRESNNQPLGDVA